MVTYEKFKKLNNEEKVALMRAYNAKYRIKIGYDKFTINGDGTVTIKNEFHETFTRKLEELTCPDFWKPYQAYDYIEYCHWRLQGCGDEEAMCRAICD